jgi:alkylation response protein AidB-like acyl-CoA dehydrogenase
VYPVHLDLTAEQALFAETSRKLIEAAVPLSEVRRRADDGGGLDRSLWRRAAELGWFGLLVPERSGGGSLSGSGILDLSLVAAELGRLVQPGPVLPTSVVAGALADDPSHGSALAGIVAGEQTAAWCGPSAPGQEERPEVKASQGGGHVALDGTAAYVQDADVADLFLVTAALEGEPRQFLVPAGTPGIEVQSLASLDLARSLAHVRFDGAVVPASCEVRLAGEAAEGVASQLAVLVALQNVETVGAADRVFEFTLAYATDRIAFGRPIGSYQAIKHRLADMLTTLECAKATAVAAVEALGAGDPEARHLVSVAKSYVGRVAPTLVQECVQLHGGVGVTWDHDIHLYLRRVAANAALHGTPDEHDQWLAAAFASRPAVADGAGAGG